MTRPRKERLSTEAMAALLERIPCHLLWFHCPDEHVVEVGRWLNSIGYDEWDQDE